MTALAASTRLQGPVSAMSNSRIKDSPPRLPRLTRLLIGLMALSAFAGIWSYMAVSLTWIGGALGWWPSGVIGGGSALALMNWLEPTAPVGARRQQQQRT
jgi:hypothetical protein